MAHPQGGEVRHAGRRMAPLRLPWVLPVTGSFLRPPGARLLLVAALLLVPSGAHTQTTGEMIERGDTAARDDRHTEAITAYEAALEADPGLAPELYAKLGRQYLWQGRPDRAVDLLERYLEARPEQCDVRMDLVLAWLWSGRLEAAIAECERVELRCPERRIEAMLRRGLAQRWSDRFEDARATYQEVAALGSEPQRDEARLGIALVDLANDLLRASLEELQTLQAARPGSVAVRGGRATALLRLGLDDAASQVIAGARNEGLSSPELLELDEVLEMRARPALMSRVEAFEDGDETRFWSFELGGKIGSPARWPVSLWLGRSQLSSSDGAELPGRSVRLEISHRFGAELAIAARAGVTELPDLDLDPLLGELDMTWTPGDHARVDVAVARIMLMDNVAAVRSRLLGDLVSLGADLRVTTYDTLMLAADLTDWSTGNRRVRLRVQPAHRFQGVPRITLSWPTAYQQYDRGFRFGLFSPREYLETGPAINVYRRVGSAWGLSAYLRVGRQHETGQPWRDLATVRLEATRDLADRWSAGAAMSWSSSNLASSTGFRRTAAVLWLTVSL